jgi:VCBS repeat-containing protein
MAAADVDGDGNADMIATQHGSNTLSVWRGNGSGGVSGGRKDHNLGFHPDGLAVSDVDRDGRDDVIVTKASSQTAYVLFGLSTGSLTLPADGYATGSSPLSIAAGDTNGDGMPDVVTAATGDGTVKRRLGGGHAALGASSDVLTSTSPRAVALADVNPDGQPDLIGVDSADDAALVAFGAGDGSFPASVSFPTGDEPVAVAPADFDEDGFTDLVVVARTAGTVDVLLNDQMDGFDARVPYTVGTHPSSVGVADLDGDGNLDLVVGNEGSDSISLLQGNGDGTFDGAQDVATGDAPVAVATGDLDEDGNEDVVTADLGDDTLSVFLGNGDGTLQARTTLAAGDAPRGLAIADMDDDTHLDLIAGAHDDQRVGVRPGNGDGTFGGRVDAALPGNPYALVVTDLDGDGREDIVVTQETTDTLAVLRNTTGVPADADVDLHVTIAAASASTYVGVPTNWTVTVANEGRSDDTAAKVVVPLASQSAISWSCTATPSSACKNASGSGAISEAGSTIRAGGSLTYSISATAPGSAGDFLTGASVAPGNGFFDEEPDDDNAYVQQSNVQPIPTTVTTSCGEVEWPGAPVAIDPGIVLDQGTFAPIGASVSISGNYSASEDVLAFANDLLTMGDIAVGSNAGGVLILTSAGGATIGEWQAALRAVTYHTTAATPSALQRTVTFSVTDAGGSPGTGTRAVTIVPADGTWACTGSLPVVANVLGLVALDAGRALVSGGISGSAALKTAEVFSGGAWTATGDMNTARLGHTLVRLADGDVLAIGGSDDVGGSGLDSVERWDDATGVWSTVAPLPTARHRPVAVLLNSGKVLVFGGLASEAGGTPVPGSVVYDPVADTWTGATMGAARLNAGAALMSSGKVLVAGGQTGPDPTDRVASAEIYDPATNSWSGAAPMGTARSYHVSVALTTGKVLVAGGHGTDDAKLSSAQLYDPASNTWSTTGEMVAAVGGTTPALLDSGAVLIAGDTNQTQLYDPVQGAWFATPDPIVLRANYGMAKLTTGKVLLAGGFSVAPCCDRQDSAELYTPPGWATADPVDFGSVDEGDTTTASAVTVTNSGGRKLAISATSIGGTNAGDFAKTSDTCAGTTLAVGGTCQVEVTFSPGAVGSRTGRLLITGSTVSSPQPIALSGSGANAPPTAGDDTDATDEDTAFGRNAAGGVLGNDTDPNTGDSVTVTKLGSTTLTGPSATGTSTKGAAVTLYATGAWEYDPTGSATLQALDGGESLDDTFAYTVADGSAATSSATVTITVSGVNDSPAVTVDAGTLAYTEDDPATAIAPGATVGDIDVENLTGGTVKLTSGYASGEDVLALPANPTDYPGVSGSPVGDTLTLSGTASTAQYQAALRAVTYANSSQDPSAATRTVSFTVTDGTATSTTRARDISVTRVDDPPVLSATAGSVSYPEGGSAIAVDPGLGASDPDSTAFTGATVSITGGLAPAEDVLGFRDQSGITGSYAAGTGVLTLSGTASLSDYRAALRSVTYRTTGSGPSTADRTIAFRARSSVSADSAAVARTVHVTLDPSPPAAPTITAGPEGEVSPLEASFGFSGPEPDGSFECSLDGAPFTACSSPFTVTVAAGPHTFEVRFVDAAGRTGPSARRTWTAGAAVPDDDNDPSAAAKGVLGGGASGKVTANGNMVAAGCSIDQGSIQSCEVDVFADDGAIGSARATARVKIGHGRVAFDERGVRQAPVTVVLTARGMKILRRLGRRAVVTFSFRVRTFDSEKILRATRKVHVVVADRFVVAARRGFSGDSSALDRTTVRYLRRLSRFLGRGVTSVRCEGHADGTGTVRYARHIALLRARMVCAFLRTHGVRARFAAVSYGSSRPVASNRTAAGRARNRRVEVVVR